MNLKQIARNYMDDTVNLASELIQIPSLSGEEEEIARYTKQIMEKLDFDEAWIDKVGNVIGKINGTGGGKSINLNSHLDTVHEGDPNDWKYPPYSGKIVDGEIWGRGASDTKGAFAVQIYAAHAMKKEGMLPKGDIYVTGVVREEDSGMGSIALNQDLITDYAVLGEATSNNLAIGNRGRMRFDIHFKGKSCHASKPQLGKNPHFAMAKFVNELENFPLDEDEVHGKSSIAPTLVQIAEKSTNIIPSGLILTIDYRNVYSDTGEVVLEKLHNTAKACGLTEEDYWIDRYKKPVRSYTGLEEKIYEGQYPFAISQDHELVVESKQALEELLNREVPTTIWNFATDAGHFTEAGVPVIGYAPAEFKYTHTVEDRISIDMMEEGLAGNMALLQRLCNLSK